MWKQEHPSLLGRQVADLNIKMAAVLALVSLYGCMQTARYENMQAYKHYYLFFFYSKPDIGGSGVARETTMSPESPMIYSLLAIFAICTYYVSSARS